MHFDRPYTCGKADGTLGTLRCYDETMYAFAQASFFTAAFQGRSRFRSPRSRPPCGGLRMSTGSEHNDVLTPEAGGGGQAARIVPGEHAPPPEMDVSTTGGTWGGGYRDASGGSGGGGGGGRDEGPDESLNAILRERNATLKDIPGDIMRAYRTGLITASHVSNYLLAKRNALSALLMAVGGAGMRNRFIADRLLLLKVAIEEGIGLFGKLTAEYEQRRDKFWDQKEFVFANLLSAILADFALVYLPAPSVRLTNASPGKSIGTWLANLAAGLPSNVFQSDRPFSLAQRIAGFGVKSLQLFGVGFVCAFSAIMLTNGLMAVRERFDENYKPSAQKQNAVVVPFLYGVFLGVSSCSRYQLVNGVESAIFPRVFAGSPKLVEECATFILRYLNTFWGSQQWVMFARWTNAQKLKPE